MYMQFPKRCIFSDLLFPIRCKSQPKWCVSSRLDPWIFLSLSVSHAGAQVEHCTRLGVPSRHHHWHCLLFANSTLQVNPTFLLLLRDHSEPKDEFHNADTAKWHSLPSWYSLTKYQAFQVLIMCPHTQHSHTNQISASFSKTFTTRYKENLMFP